MLSEILVLLESDRRGLLAAVERVHEADRDRRPAEHRWSVAEILEHLAAVEHAVAKLVATRGQEPVPPDQEPPVPNAADRVATLRTRGQRIEVPGHLAPTGTMTAAEAARALTVSRRELLAAAEQADPVALEERTYHHAVLGRLPLRQWLAFVAHHEARHAAQIDEIGKAFRS